MRAITFAALLSAIPVLASAQNPAPANDPIVQVGLYGYRADGSLGSSAHDTAPELSSIVYMNGQRCLMGAGNRPAPADATDVWQFKGKVLSSTPEQAVVQLEWRRTVANGLRIDGNESSLQLNLRIGEAVQLDQAGMEGKPGCPTVAVGFEARYAPRFWGLPPGVIGGGGGRAGSSASGSGGGSGSGGMTVKMGTVSRSGGFGTSVAVPQSGGDGGGTAATASSGLFDVNLWLVRTVPGRPDEVNHATLRMNETGASFSFAPIAVTTSRGEAFVQVTGNLAVVRGTSGEEQLVFSTSRRVGLTAPGQAPRDSAPDSSGTSRIINRMPGPEEVLSFEMPPITLNGQQAAPDQLSVRLTIAPRRKPGESPQH
jgi:hypothetical protein